MENSSALAVIPDRRRGFLLRELLSPPLEVASIAFVWSAAKPLPCQMHWAGHGPTPHFRAEAHTHSKLRAFLRKRFYPPPAPQLQRGTSPPLRNPQLSEGTREIISERSLIMKKDIKFSTRMASADREKIKALAAKAHMSMSDYVTACCLHNTTQVRLGVVLRSRGSTMLCRLQLCRVACFVGAPDECTF